ncbi:aldehyde ferredoxin oxidoreductase family protein [Thermodesulfobacteriota bacterium]
MKSLGGYMGRILRVDLSNRTLTDEELGEELLSRFMGGAALGAKILYEETPEGIDALHPDNPMIFGTGPVTGTAVPGTGGWNLVCKGPLVSGFSVSSQAQGHFGARLKFAGYDDIVVKGASDKWCYLFIHDGKAEIKDASHLVGKDAFETNDLLKSELNLPKASVVSIGPAGENMIDIACVQGDRGHNIGNGGAGAVMGSKKLKAIVVSGTNKVPIHNPEKFSELVKEWAQTLMTLPTGAAVNAGGTLAWQEGIYKQGWLPVKNLTTNIFPEWANFTGEALRSDKSIERKRDTCHSCVLNHCSQLKIVDGPHAGWEGEEPEYEPTAQFSANIGGTHLHDAIVLADLNDRMGMNVNGAGFAIALAMECYEKGIITQKDTDGLELTWGNVDAVRQLLPKMANREGFGAVLCDGPMKAAQRIGGDAEKFAVYLGKGNPPHGHDPRGLWPILFTQVVTNNSSAQGGSLNPVFDPKKVAKYEKGGVVFCHTTDSAVLCNFVSTGPPHLASAINFATGWELTAQEVMLHGERAVNLLRLFNIREGVTPEHETASPRLLESSPDGPNEGKTIEPHLKEMRADYHRYMGWDEVTGKPLPETLEGLGIKE